MLVITCDGLIKNMLEDCKWDSGKQAEPHGNGGANWLSLPLASCLPLMAEAK